MKTFIEELLKEAGKTQTAEKGVSTFRKIWNTTGKPMRFLGKGVQAAGKGLEKFPRAVPAVAVTGAVGYPIYKAKKQNQQQGYDYLTSTSEGNQDYVQG
jgi:hypothetical protein